MLTQTPYPLHMILLVQKEVAERIVAKPGNLSILGLSVQLVSTVRIITTVPATAFFPAPKVASAIIEIANIRQTPQLSSQQEKLFFTLIRAGFAQRRKLLKKNLTGLPLSNGQLSEAEVNLALTTANISPQARAQELSLEQWLSLVNQFADSSK
jgi:16S rRNA (adenine1518-N6/adenine1519-N6)-dimethyltransferase